MKLFRQETDSTETEAIEKNPAKRTPIQLLTDYSPHIVILLLAAFCAVRFPLFLRNAPMDLMKRIAAYSLISIAMGCVMLVGEIDLSAGRNFGLAAVLSGVLIDKGLYYYNDLTMPNPYLLIIIGILTAVSVGLLVGLLNGLIVTRLKTPSFISTLAMQMILYGCMLVVLCLPILEQFSYRSVSAIIHEAKVLVVFKTEIGGVEIPHYVWYAIGVVIIMWFVWNLTKLGKNMRKVGRDRSAAEAEGVRVTGTVIAAFVIAGLLIGLNGFIEAVRVGGAGAGAGNCMEIEAIIACLLGGMSLKGGRGRITGILIGLAFTQILSVSLQWLAVSANLVYVIKGVLLAMAAVVSVNRDLRNKKRNFEDTIPPVEEIPAAQQDTL